MNQSKCAETIWIANGIDTKEKLIGFLERLFMSVLFDRDEKVDLKNALHAFVMGDFIERFSQNFGKKMNASERTFEIIMEAAHLSVQEHEYTSYQCLINLYCWLVDTHEILIKHVSGKNSMRRKIEAYNCAVIEICKVIDLESRLLLEPGTIASFLIIDISDAYDISAALSEKIRVFLQNIESCEPDNVVKKFENLLGFKGGKQNGKKRR